MRLRERQGVIFVGIGSLGWKRSIDLNAVNSIAEEAHRMNYPGGQGQAIVLEGKSRLRFGTNLSEARRHFILNALRLIKAGQV